MTDVFLGNLDCKPGKLLMSRDGNKRRKSLFSIGRERERERERSFENYLKMKKEKRKKKKKSTTQPEEPIYR